MWGVKSLNIVAELNSTPTDESTQMESSITVVPETTSRPPIYTSTITDSTTDNEQPTIVASTTDNGQTTIADSTTDNGQQDIAAPTTDNGQGTIAFPTTDNGPVIVAESTEPSGHDSMRGLSEVSKLRLSN